MTNTTQRIDWLDSLRAIAILGVIIIHVSSPVVNMSYGKNMFHWWTGNIFDSMVRFSVPLFLMISGATLLSKSYDLKTFYKKRFLRVFVPFLFWMLVYWVFRWCTLPTSIRPVGFDNVINWGIAIFLKEGISKHLWYVYMLVVLYFFTPFIGMSVRKLRAEMLVFLLLAWVLICNISKNFPVDMYGWKGNLFPKFFTYFLYSGYMVLGYYLHRWMITSKNIRLSAFLLYLLTVCASAFMAFYSSKFKGQLDLSIYGYFSLNTMVQACALFISLKGIEIQNTKLHRVQNLLSDYSYGIYLSHILVLGVFFNIGIFWTMANPLLSIPAIVILTLTASLLIVFALRKLPPFGKYISG